jgi:hypothetical protein
MKIEEVLLKAEEKRKTIEEKLAKLKIKIGEADGPMESSGISLSRWILEDEIMLAQKEMNRLEKIINELKKIKGPVKTVKVKIGGGFKNFLVINGVEDLELGIVDNQTRLDTYCRRGLH